MLVFSAGCEIGSCVATAGGSGFSSAVGSPASCRQKRRSPGRTTPDSRCAGRGMRGGAGKRGPSCKCITTSGVSGWSRPDEPALPKIAACDRVEFLRRSQLVHLHVTRQPVRIAQALRMRELWREHLFVFSETDDAPWARTRAEVCGMAGACCCCCFCAGGSSWVRSGRRRWLGDDIQNLAARPGNKTAQAADAPADLFVKLVILAAQDLPLDQSRLKRQVVRRGGQLRQHFRQRIVAACISEIDGFAGLDHNHAHPLEPVLAKHERRRDFPLDADKKHRCAHLHSGSSKPAIPRGSNIEILFVT